MTKTPSLKKDSFTFFISRAIVFPFSILTSIMIARTLGPSGKGALDILNLLTSIIFLFASLGIYQANIYFIGQEKEKTGVIISTATIFSLVIGTLLAGIIWLLKNQIAGWLSLRSYPLEVGLVALLIPLTLLQNVYIYLLMGLKKVLERNIATILSYGVPFVMILWFFFQGGVSVFKVLGATALADMVIVVYCFIIIVKNTSVRLFSFDWPIFKKTTKYGAKLQIGNIMQVFNYRLDMLLVNYYIGVYGVGIYTVAVTLGELLWNIPNVIGTVLFPRVSDSLNKFEDTNTVSICRKTTLITTAGAVFLMASAQLLIPLLYGSRFKASILPLVLLLPGIIGLSIQKILISALLGKGYPQYMTWSGLIGLIFTIIFDVILIPTLGVSGASLASTIAYSICALCTVYWFKKVSQIAYTQILIPQKEDYLYFINYLRNLITRLKFHESRSDNP